MKEKEKLLLETLSFLEPMTLEKVILDLDEASAHNLELTNEDLLQILDQLCRSQKVKQLDLNGDQAWQRVFPKKSLLNKLLNLFR